MAGANMQEFTDDNFQSDVIASDVPVLVDFWAEWCMPCRMLAPIVEELSNEFEGKARIGKLDTDKNRNVAVEYKITAIPTIIIFKGGEVAKKFVGLTNKQDLEAALNELA